MFKTAQFEFLNSHKGTIRDYKCGYCDLRIWFKCNSSIALTDSYWVLDQKNPYSLLGDGLISHAKCCNIVQSKNITDTFLILNHPYLF